MDPDHIGAVVLAIVSLVLIVAGVIAELRDDR